MAVAALTACGACGEAEDGAYFGTTARVGKEVTTLYLNNHSEPEYLDPGLAVDTVSTVLLTELFEGLVVKHPQDLHLTQGVAERYDKSADNRIYRFYLRKEARWSDGEPVTAYDFVYAWRRVLAPATGARGATMLYVLKNGKAFHQSKLKELKRRVVLRAKPNATAAAGKVLKQGAAVRLLEKPAADAQWVQVEAFDDLPSYRPKQAAKTAPKEATEPAPERGYVPLDALAPGGAFIGVRAVDDHTLEVELDNPTPYFLELCTVPRMAPVRRDLIERFAQSGNPERWTRPEHIITNGPFMLDEWKFRYEITFKQNPHYHDRDKLKLKRVVWLTVPEAHATMNLYRTGEVDYLGANAALPPAYKERLTAYQDFKHAPYLAVYWYDINITKPPLDNILVRKALNLAVDKQQLTDRVTRGGQQPATHFVPDLTGSGYARQVKREREKGADPFAAPERKHNPERARALLKEAGYNVQKRKDGYHTPDFPALEILYNTAEGNRLIAVAIQSMFKEHLGISVQLRNEEWKVFLKNYRDGHFQLARMGWSAEYNHPHTWLGLFLSYNENNATGYDSPRYDQLLQDAAATADPVESIRKYRQAELIAVDATVRISLYFYTKSSLIKPYVRGFYPNAQNQHPIRWMWIDPRWRDGGDNRPAYTPRELPEPRILGARGAPKDAAAKEPPGPKGEQGAAP